MQFGLQVCIHLESCRYSHSGLFASSGRGPLYVNCFNSTYGLQATDFFHHTVRLDKPWLW